MSVFTSSIACANDALDILMDAIAVIFSVNGRFNEVLINVMEIIDDYL